MIKQTTYCGFVTIIGRTNVGKSTLLNQLLGQKISITSNKPQTTRHHINGIYTDGIYQIIYVDTPGIYIKGKQDINRLMNKTINNSNSTMKIVILVTESTHWFPEDETLINKLRNINCQIILAINKIDNIFNKKHLLPHINFLSKQISLYDIVPICAKSGMNIDILAKIIRKSLPKAKHQFPSNYITDQSQRFIASEIIREKLMRFLGDELPYSIKVEIKDFIYNNCNNYNIHGLILVEKYSQKKIVIGNDGAKIKIIGMRARKDMEVIFNARVHLKLWVKVKFN